LKNIYRIKNLEILENWVDTNKFKKDKKEREIFRKELKINENEIVFLMTGSSWKAKGYHILIKAFEICHKKHKNIRLILAGHNFNKDNILKYLNNKENIKKIITINDYKQEDLVRIFSASDIFVYPGLIYEDAPYSLLEALSFSMPVLYSDIANKSKYNLKEIPFYHKPGNFYKLSKDMEFFILNPKEIEKYSLISRKIAQEKYSIEIGEKKLINILSINS